jgi:hypothetical protein
MTRRAEEVKMPVEPGQQLGFVDLLRTAELFPLPVGRHRNKNHPPLTPFIVVRATPQDVGQRPSSALGTAPRPLHSVSITVRDDQGRAVAAPIVGTTYVLSCEILNFGAVGAFSGIVEFYVEDATVFDELAASSEATLPALGYAGFVGLPDAAVTVICPKQFTPRNSPAVTSSILVHAYDPFFDQLTNPFDARADRHVGRLDLSDFSGRWEGSEVDVTLTGSPATPQAIELTIGQDGLDVEVNDGGPVMAAQIRDGHIEVSRPIINANGQGNEFYTLSLTTPDSLHSTHDLTIPVPSEPPLPLFTLSNREGDLKRG